MQGCTSSLSPSSSSLTTAPALDGNRSAGGGVGAAAAASRSSSGTCAPGLQMIARVDVLSPPLEAFEGLAHLGGITDVLPDGLEQPLVEERVEEVATCEHLRVLCLEALLDALELEVDEGVVKELIRAARR
eukprot:735662-Prymnesium_polylepis.2